jgi:hypothetical protein
LPFLTDLEDLEDLDDFLPLPLPFLTDLEDLDFLDFEDLEDLDDFLPLPFLTDLEDFDFFDFEDLDDLDDLLPAWKRRWIVLVWTFLCLAVFLSDDVFLASALAFADEEAWWFLLELSVLIDLLTDTRPPFP